MKRYTMFLCWKKQYCENDYTTQIYQRLHYSNIQCNPCQTANSIFHRTRTKIFTIYINSVQSLSHIWLFVTPWTAAPQASGPSPTPGIHTNPCPLSQWCHPAISSFVVPFCSCPQSFPASQSFPIGQIFAWGGQSTWVSALASVLPKKTQDWSLSEWIGWISLQSKGISRVFSYTTVQKHQFIGAQPSS